MKEGRTDQLDFSALDLLFLNARLAQLRLIKRKERQARLFEKEISGLRYSEHFVGDGAGFRAQACGLGLAGAIQASRSTLCAGRPGGSGSNPNS
jgi:ATP-dependent DNA ligase